MALDRTSSESSERSKDRPETLGADRAVVRAREVASDSDEGLTPDSSLRPVRRASAHTLMVRRQRLARLLVRRLIPLLLALSLVLVASKESLAPHFIPAGLRDAESVLWVTSHREAELVPSPPRCQQAHICPAALPWPSSRQPTTNPFSLRRAF